MPIGVNFQKKIAKEEMYDGYYGVTTNLIGEIKEIMKIIRGKWEIEESFRILKYDFASRPVELSREDRIRSHFTICFISLFIYRLLEKRLDNKYTVSQILECLRNMSVLELKGDGYLPAYERTNITDDLHNAFDFRTDYEINSYKNIEKIIHKIKR